MPDSFAQSYRASCFIYLFSLCLFYSSLIFNSLSSKLCHPFWNILWFICTLEEHGFVCVYVYYCSCIPRIILFGFLFCTIFSWAPSLLSGVTRWLVLSAASVSASCTHLLCSHPVKASFNEWIFHLSGALSRVSKYFFVCLFVLDSVLLLSFFPSPSLSFLSVILSSFINL